MWFLMEARLSILRPSLDLWRWNKSENGLKFKFWVSVGLARKTRQSLIGNYHSLPREKWFFTNCIKPKHIIYQIEVYKDKNHFALVLGSGDDRRRRKCCLKPRVPHVCDSGHIFGESPPLEGWIRLVSDRGGWSHYSLDRRRPRNGQPMANFHGGRGLYARPPSLMTTAVGNHLPWGSMFLDPAIMFR